MPFLFFPFSAKTHAELSQKLVDMLKWLEEGAENYAAEDISYTLVQGRSHFSVRLAVVAKDGQELKHTLSAMLSKDEAEYTCKDQSSQQRELSLPGYADRLLQELRANISLAQKKCKKNLACWQI